MGKRRVAQFAHVCPECGAGYNTSMAAHFGLHPKCAAAAGALEELGYDSNDDLCAERAPTHANPAIELALGEIRHQVACDLADLRFEHGLGDAGIEFVRKITRRWLGLRSKVEKAVLAEKITDPTQLGNALSAMNVDLFDGLATAKLEIAEMKSTVPYIEPRRVVIDDESIVSFDIGELITRRLQHCPKFLERCEKKSDEWKLGLKHRVAPSAEDELGDFDDAVVARFHPHLMRKATEDEADDFRIGLDMDADDVEVSFGLHP